MNINASVIQQVAQRLIAAEHIAVFSGSGLSAEPPSNIPTFRGEGGLWDEYSPSWYATFPGLMCISVFRPGRFKDFINDVVKTFLDAEPNAGHRALADVEKMCNGTMTCVTQNIDGLHQEAGSSTCWEVHGSLLRMACTSSSCGAVRSITKPQLQDICDKFLEGGWLLPRIFSGNGMPHCEKCNSLEEPGVVLFGQSLPEQDWNNSQIAMEEADVLLVIGSSVMVYPAAELPRIAARRNAFVIEINPEPAFQRADVRLQASACEVLPLIVEEIQKLQSQIS